MCGIVGIAGSNREDHVREMARLIIHRGPDDEGFFTGPRLSMGMRRLSIIDLSGGGQPIYNETGTVVTVFNGEIYNFRELRGELEGRGHRFRTWSDTEVIVHLYEEYGADFPEHLNGMFAIAVWDADRERLLLVRDRFGIKPLFYAPMGGTLAFASELKCFLPLPGLDRAIDPAAVELYLSYLYVPGPRSIFKGVRKLPPAHLIEWEGGRTRVRRWYALPDAPTADLTEDEAVERLDALLSEAVRRQLVSDVPIGMFLSGGLDSSLLTAYMARHLTAPVRTFSIGYGPETPAFNETAHAETVAGLLGTDHHELSANPAVENLLGPLAWHLDEPFGNSSAIPAWLISSQAAASVKVILGGAGGDELFGGYPRLWAMGLAAGFRKLPRPVRRSMAALLSLLPESQRGLHVLRRARTFGRGLSGDPLAGYLAWLRYVDVSARERVFSDDFIQALSAETGYEGPAPDYLDRIRRTADPVHDAYRLDMETWLPYNILEYSDKMSMMASIEQRVPFLDNDVVDFAFRLPRRMCIRGRTLKHILKRVAERHLPRRIVYRPKQGFMVPVGVWIRGPLRGVMEDMLSETAVRRRGILRPSFVKGVVRDHFSGWRDRTHHIWMLMMLEQWFRCYVDGEVPPIPKAAP